MNRQPWPEVLAVCVVAVATCICVAGWPDLSGQTSAAWAAWVQGVGSIAAIFFAARIGKQQAETALEIHLRDVEHRNSEYEKARSDKKEEDAIVAQEMREDALAEAAVHRILVKRLSLDLIVTIMKIEAAFIDLYDEQQAVARAKQKMDEAIKAQIGHEVDRARRSFDNAKSCLQVAQNKLDEIRFELERAISELSGLPRHTLRVCSPLLANRITYAINGLQSAVIEMEHSKRRKSTVDYVSAAIRDLEAYLIELSQLLGVDQNKDKPH